MVIPMHAQELASENFIVGFSSIAFTHVYCLTYQTMTCWIVS